MATTGIVSTADRQKLLRIARDAVRDFLGVRDPAPREAAGSTDRIEGTFSGAFVTLWVGRRLRGCVGTFASTTDIVRTISEVTRSALADSRFTSCPLTSADLAGLTIEISILSPLEPVANPPALVLGTHGVVIRRGHRSGCFLPKVAIDRGWSAEEFLSHCCTMKAGLAPDAWRQKGTEVLLFTAEVFSESTDNASNGLAGDRREAS